MSRWPERPLRELVERTETRDPRRAPEAEFRYLDIASVDNQAGVIGEARTLRGAEAPLRARKVIRAGDVIVATTRPYLNQVALVPGELDNEICSTGFCVLRSNGAVDSRFLYRFTRSKRFIDQIVPRMRGSTYPAVSDGDVLDAVMPVPPLDEQRRIAAKLDAILDKVASTAMDRAATRSTLDFVVERVFEKLLPTSDRTVAFGSFLTERLANGKSFVGGEGPPGIPLLKLGAVTWGTFDESQIKYARVEVPEESRLWVRSGDFLVTRSNTANLVGRAAIYRGEIGRVLYPDLMIRARLDEARCDPRFLVRLFNGVRGRAYFVGMAHGTSPSMKKISQADVERFPVPDLPLGVQKAIADRCYEVQSRVSNVTDLVGDADRLTGAAKAAALDRAFQGELV